MLNKSSSKNFDPTRWDGILKDIAQRNRVPGMIAGVMRVGRKDGRTRQFVAKTGVENRLTDAEVNRETVGQLGSITKLFTTTMIMQLREEGKLDLDTPVAELIPGFTLRSGGSQHITVWNLLTHTSGIDGDVFSERHRGKDAVKLFVESLDSVELLFQPGTGWSYCNSGFVLAGRIIEVLDGASWDESVQIRVAQRLGLDRLFTLPEQVLPYSYMNGHIRLPGTNTWEAVTLPDMIRGRGPAGVIVSNIDNLLTFGAAFLPDRVNTAGNPLLSKESMLEMTTPQWTLDVAASTGDATHWGLGWMLDEWEDHPVWRHSGVKLGNRAWLYTLPEDGLVMAILGNGGQVSAAAEEICAAFAEEFAEVCPNPGPVPLGSATDVCLSEGQLGTYRDAGTELQVIPGSGHGAMIKLDQTGMHRYMNPDHKSVNSASSDMLALYPTGVRDTFVLREDPYSPWTQVSFTEIDDKRVAYFGKRCLPKSNTNAGAYV